MSKNKVLVCITPQSNSKRLIDRGLETSKKISGELHILHVIKGYDIFESDDSKNLLQYLFDYGTSRGGIVHAISAKDVSITIGQFLKEERITNLILGVSPKEGEICNDSVSKEEVYEKILSYVPHLKISLKIELVDNAS